MASAGDAKILLLDFTMPFLAGGCVEIRLAARERLHGQPFIIRPPEAPKCGELETSTSRPGLGDTRAAAAAAASPSARISGRPSPRCSGASKVSRPPSKSSPAWLR